MPAVANYSPHRTSYASGDRPKFGLTKHRKLVCLLLHRSRQQQTEYRQTSHLTTGGMLLSPRRAKTRQMDTFAMAVLHYCQGGIGQECQESKSKQIDQQSLTLYWFGAGLIGGTRLEMAKELFGSRSEAAHRGTKRLARLGHGVSQSDCCCAVINRNASNPSSLGKHARRANDNARQHNGRISKC